LFGGKKLTAQNYLAKVPDVRIQRSAQRNVLPERLRPILLVDSKFGLNLLIGVSLRGVRRAGSSGTAHVAFCERLVVGLELHPSLIDQVFQLEFALLIVLDQISL
jgi:hypothetical protein